MPATAPARSAPLTDAQLAEFHERGFLLVRGLVPAATIAALQEEIDGLHERMARAPHPGVHLSWEEGLAEGRPARIRQLMNSEVVSPIVDAISRGDAMLGVLRQLMGDDIRLYHSKLMMKAAQDGTFTPWHQDWSYWKNQSIAPKQVNCMLAIDAADEANGAIRFIPGSHKQGYVEHRTLQSSSFSLGLPGGLGDYQSELVGMQPGDGVFFGALVIHGSGPNASPRDRRANTFAYDVHGNQRNGELPEASWRSGRR